MNSALILGILQLVFEEANRIAENTKADHDVAIATAAFDLITAVKAKIALQANQPIDLSTL